MTLAEAKAAGWTIIPSPFELGRIYEEARRHVLKRTSPAGLSNVAVHQAFLRKVSREFHTRLRAARIYVEGA